MPNDQPFYQLKDYLKKCRTMNIEGKSVRMPLELKRRYAESITSAERLLRPKKLETQPAYASLFGYLIEQCELARAYKFPELEMRERDNMVLSSAPDARKCATKLASILQKYPHAFAWAVSNAILDKGVHLRTVEDDTVDSNEMVEVEGYGFYPNWEARIPVGAVGGGSAYSIRLSELLGSFASAIEAEKLLARKGSFLHRFRYGPLYFPETKEGRRGELPDHAICLAAFLSFLIRKSQTTCSMRWHQGEIISSEDATHVPHVEKLEDRPQWSLIEELVNDALGKRIAPELVRQFLKRNERIEVWGYQ